MEMKENPFIVEGRYKGLLDDIDALESYEALARLTTPNLTDTQTKDLLHALAVKTFCCMYDTGLGKTFIAAAFMRALKNRNPNAKFLLFGTASQLAQTPEKISSISGLKVKGYTESPFDVFNENDLNKYDVIMLTHGCLNVREHMLMLSYYLDRFDGIVVDELHLVSNFIKSRNAQMLQALFERFEYRLALTATPITTNTDQLARALHMLNPSEVRDWKEISRDIKFAGSSSLGGNLSELFVVRQRPKNNHEGIPIIVPAMTHQIGAEGQYMFETTKGPNATNQHEKVLEIIKSHGNSPGLIYANRRVVQKALVDFLVSKGVRVALKNGATTKAKTREIIDGFKKGQYDVLITNTKEALDLDCDWVMMYEFTPHVKQFIGRAERGFISKNLKVYFMFTKDTGEFDFFYRRVYLISQTIQDLLSMDLSEVLSLRNTIHTHVFKE